MTFNLYSVSEGGNHVNLSLGGSAFGITSPHAVVNMQGVKSDHATFGLVGDLINLMVKRRTRERLLTNYPYVSYVLGYQMMSLETWIKICCNVLSMSVTVTL